MSLPGRAWKAGKPLFLRLPRIYRSNPITVWLSSFWDEFLLEIYNKVLDVYNRQLRIVDADERWVDWLSPLLGWSDSYWNPSWSLAGKKALLLNSFLGELIWETKGSRETLSFVLTCAGIKNYVEVDGDFIIGTNEIGDPIGYDPWSFTVYLPPEYQGTDKYREAERIVQLFKPAWTEHSYVYDEERFRIVELMTAEDGSVITTESDEFIQSED